METVPDVFKLTGYTGEEAMAEFNRRCRTEGSPYRACSSCGCVVISGNAWQQGACGPDGGFCAACRGVGAPAEEHKLVSTEGQEVLDMIDGTRGLTFMARRVKSGPPAAAPVDPVASLKDRKAQQSESRP